MRTVLPSLRVHRSLQVLTVNRRFFLPAPKPLERTILFVTSVIVKEIQRRVALQRKPIIILQTCSMMKRTKWKLWSEMVSVGQSFSIPHTERLKWGAWLGSPWAVQAKKRANPSAIYMEEKFKKDLVFACLILTWTNSAIVWFWVLMEITQSMSLLNGTCTLEQLCQDVSRDLKLNR